MLEGYFALEGRIGRWRFFLYSLALWIIVPVLILLTVAALGHARNPFIAGLIAFSAIAAFSGWAGLALVVKRLHDLDKSGWHYVWMFLLPGLLTGGFSVHWTGGGGGAWTIGYGQIWGIVPLLAFLWLVLARGTDGPNTYGYPP
jgi:uncharacterized membrane protein YhaH (DUF805 family)